MPQLKLYNLVPPTVDWSMALPILFMLFFGVVALVLMALQTKRETLTLQASVVVGSVLAIYSCYKQLGMESGSTFSNMLVRDKMSLILQGAIALVTLLVALSSDSYLKQKRIAYREFYPLLAWAAAGAMIMVSTTNLLMLFVGLEVLSISLYVMAGMSFYELKSEESALKYFLLGAFASAFLLYGISFVYGATGTVELSKIVAAYGLAPSGLLEFGGVLMMIGLMFKAALVPFHQWTPDVYQGAPTNVTAFMAAASKIAAIGALYRVMEACQVFQSLWMPALFWVAILTMLVPNFLALVQKDVKRVLGFSSIANAGYVLVGMISAVQMKSGPGVAVIFLVGYSLTTVGAFTVLSLTAKGAQEGTSFDDLRGLWRSSPVAALALLLCVCSLIGIPISAGFFGKLWIFQEALAAKQVALAVVLAIGSLISLYYYLRILHAAFIAEPEGEVRLARPVLAQQVVLVVCSTGVVGLMFLLGPLSALLHH